MVALSYAERARLAQPKDDEEKSAQKQDHNTIVDQIHSQPSTNPGSSATSTTGTLTSSPPLSAHPQPPTPNIPGLLSSPSSPVDTKHSIDTNHPYHPSAQDSPAPLSQPKPNAWTARKQSHMASVVPPQKQLNGYVQQPATARPTTTHHADHARLPPPSSFSSSVNKHPDSDFGSTNHNSLPPLNDPNNWPEMGKVVPSTSSHRSRQSVTSLLSVTMVSGTQNSIIDPSAVQENPVQADEPASVKKPKGEKTKWKPIPPEELQAAADAANRSYSHSNSSRTTSRQHSPHVNGRGMRRLPSEDFHPERSPATKRQTTRTAPEKAELVIPGGSGSRNEHGTGLDQRGAMAPRVSPLRGASNLPRVPSSQNSPVEMRHSSQSSNIGQPNHHHHPGSAWPSRGRNNRGYYASYSQHGGHPSNRRLRYNNGVNEAVVSQPGVSSYIPPSNTPSIPPAQHPHVHGQTQSYQSYPQLFYFPHHPTYPLTHAYAQTPPPTQDAINTYSIDDGQSPTRPREKRKRRPHPSEAVAVAGYRSFYPEVLIMDLEPIEGGPKFWVVVEDEETVMELDEAKPPRYRARQRAPWTIGVDDSLRAQRWPWSLDIVEENPEEDRSMEKERTWTFGNVGEPATPPSLVALAADLKVGDAILSAASPANETKMHGAMVQAPYAAGWPAPGAGPSALDIGMAMGVMPHATPLGIPAPPMLSLSMPPHSHPGSHQSPSTAVQANMEWAIRDDPFVVVPPPSQQQYRPYNGPVYQPSPSQRDAGQETHTGGYGAGRGRYEGEGLGWKSDRGYGNGEYRAFVRGRGRGFPRGRGFRGFSGGYHRQYAGSPGVAQGPPPPLPPNGPVIYIPEPIIPPPFTPFTPTIPNGYGGIYGAESPITPGANVTGAPARRPSPKPLSSIQFPLDAIRYKLLGQVEYYFSSDNLARDLYLRQHMDSQGWVSLDILQTFPRLKELQVSTDVIRETLFLSQYLEVRANYVRMVNDGWKAFIMPDAEESKVAAVDTGYHPAAVYSVPPSQPGVWYPQQQLQHPGYVVGGMIPAPYYPQPGYSPHAGYPLAQPYMPAPLQDVGENQPGNDSRGSGENEEGITSEEDDIEIVIAEADNNPHALRPSQHATTTSSAPSEHSAA